jgi:hypothetical protein
LAIKKIKFLSPKFEGTDSYFGLFVSNQSFFALNRLSPINY